MIMAPAARIAIPNSYAWVQDVPTERSSRLPHACGHEISKAPRFVPPKASKDALLAIHAAVAVWILA
jgi:hypothetical protein